jgi:hypothetical protein
MERYNFGTYLVDDENRSAYTQCHAIASLTSPAPQPVLLLGEPGCGKTHLLYSVVNRVRSQFSDVGIAYINAEEFPDQIRNLILDPSPLKKTDEAILLVDELDSFSEEGEVLEEVIRLFMKEEHFIIVASNVHPKRLKLLPDSLVSLLLQGTICPIHPEQSDRRDVTIEDNARAEHGKDLERLKHEMAALQAQSVNAGIASNLERLNSNADDSLLLALKEELEEVRSQLEKTQVQLTVANESLEDSSVPTVESTQLEEDDFEELKLQIENLKGENALLSFAEKESRGLREQLQRAKDELETIQQGATQESAPDSESTQIHDTRVLNEAAEDCVRIEEELKTELNDERDELSERIVELQEMTMERKNIIDALNIVIEDSSESCSIGDILTAIQDLKDQRLDLMANLTRSVDELTDANSKVGTLTEDLEQQKLLMTDMEMAMEVLRNEGFQGQLDLKGQIQDLEEAVKSAEEREAQSHLRDEALSLQLNSVLESISRERGIPMHELSNDPQIIQLKSFSEDVPSSPNPFTIEIDNQEQEEPPLETEDSAEGVHLDSPKAETFDSARIVTLESRNMYHIEEMDPDDLRHNDENQTA